MPVIQSRQSYITTFASDFDLQQYRVCECVFIVRIVNANGLPHIQMKGCRRQWRMCCDVEIHLAIMRNL